MEMMNLKQQKRLDILEVKPQSALSTSLVAFN